MIHCTPFHRPFTNLSQLQNVKKHVGKTSGKYKIMSSFLNFSFTLYIKPDISLHLPQLFLTTFCNLYFTGFSRTLK